MRPLTPVRDPNSRSRISQLRAFEILIFVLMAILLALCLAAVPAVSKKEMVEESVEPIKGGAVLRTLQAKFAHA
jgi:hypothetical protein